MKIDTSKIKIATQISGISKFYKVIFFAEISDNNYCIFAVPFLYSVFLELIEYIKKYVYFSKIKINAILSKDGSLIEHNVNQKAKCDGRWFIRGNNFSVSYTDQNGYFLNGNKIKKVFFSLI